MTTKGQNDKPQSSSCLLKADGTMAEYLPKNGKYFTLKELQSAVGGYIEIIYLSNGMQMVVNEEGRILGLPVNKQATILGQYDGVLGLHNQIVGNVLIAPARMMR